MNTHPTLTKQHLSIRVVGNQKDTQGKIEMQLKYNLDY